MKRFDETKANTIPVNDIDSIHGTVLFHTEVSVLYCPFRFIQRMLLSEILFIAP